MIESFHDTIFEEFSHKLLDLNSTEAATVASSLRIAKYYPSELLTEKICFVASSKGNQGLINEIHSLSLVLEFLTTFNIKGDVI